VRLFIQVLLLQIVFTSALANSTDFLPLPSTDLVKHTYYTLSYNEANEQANWVYYTLTDSMVLNGGAERSNKFKVDKLVVTGSAKTSDYSNSGYDRGHLCPAADMGFNPTAMQESFFMSNISPQFPGFNRGIWKELETNVREWAKQEHKIIVVAGPVFKSNRGTIGEDHVLVPGYFYKVIYDATDTPRMIAFVFPNEKTDRPLTDFVVATDEVEKLANLDFFSQLPDEMEDNLESKVDFSGWFEGYSSPEPLAVKSPDVKIDQQTSDTKFYLILISVLVLAILYVSVNRRKRK
jgi:endonuclease G